MTNDPNSIGVFDSGFGGLDVFRGIVEELPQYSYIYLADSARAPYGPRTKEEVLEFTKQGVKFLFSKGARLVILACNTASSDALRSIQQNFLKTYPGRNVLGVLVPAAEEAVRVTKNSIVGVIGTEQTIASKSFEREILKLDPSIELHTMACPELVPLIEHGLADSKELEDALEKYLQPLCARSIDTLVLGCTHYGLIENAIRDVVGEHIHIVRESRVVPSHLKAYLARHPEYETYLSTEATVTFYTTDTTDRFERLGAEFYAKPITAERIGLK